MSAQTYKISAEEGEEYQKLDVNNISMKLQSSAGNAGGNWVNIQYKYQTEDGKGKMDKLRIQTSELFSYGISQFEDNHTSPLKMALVMSNKKLKEEQSKGMVLTEDEIIDLKIEDETIQMLNDITEKIKQCMKQPEMIRDLGKQRGKKWDTGVDSMVIVKGQDQEQENGDPPPSKIVNAKIVTNKNFMETKFYTIDEQCEMKPADSQTIIKRLLQKTTNCKVTVLMVVDSVYVKQAPFIQIKLTEVVVSEFIENINKRAISLPKRFKDKFATRPTITYESTKSESTTNDDLSSSEDEDEAPLKMKPKKKIIKDDSDSESD